MSLTIVDLSDQGNTLQISYKSLSKFFNSRESLVDTRQVTSELLALHLEQNSHSRKSG